MGVVCWLWEPIFYVRKNNFDKKQSNLKKSVFLLHENLLKLFNGLLVMGMFFTTKKVLKEKT